MKHINEDQTIDHLDIIPVAGIGSKLQIAILPIFILALMGATFYFSGFEAGTELVKEWIIVKGVCAAIGAIIALAHPISIILAFLAAPIGNFNPIIKPGWLAALTEIWMKKPLVEDFEKIADDSEHFTGFWKNRVLKIFLVLLLPQVGSSIGTFLVTWKGIKGLF